MVTTQHCRNLSEVFALPAGNIPTPQMSSLFFQHYLHSFVYHPMYHVMFRTAHLPSHLLDTKALPLAVLSLDSSGR